MNFNKTMLTLKQIYPLPKPKGKQKLSVAFTATDDEGWLTILKESIPIKYNMNHLKLAEPNIGKPN